MEILTTRGAVEQCFLRVCPSCVCRSCTHIKTHIYTNMRADDTNTVTDIWCQEMQQQTNNSRKNAALHSHHKHNLICWAALNVNLTLVDPHHPLKSVKSFLLHTGYSTWIVWLNKQHVVVLSLKVVSTAGPDSSVATKPIPMLSVWLSTEFSRLRPAVWSRPTQALWSRVTMKSTTWRKDKPSHGHK